ncbi:MAG: hypothetical protein P8J87_19530 [Verrucomicrobiales bacterium]|nr:hypothetical protein [Verrucomicrobiales bacterium]
MNQNVTEKLGEFFSGKSIGGWKVLVFSPFTSARPVGMATGEGWGRKTWKKWVARRMVFLTVVGQCLRGGAAMLWRKGSGGGWVFNPADWFRFGMPN